jgi:carbon-monoxide dehydrogenase small subunit
MPVVSMTVNGRQVSADVDSRTLLVQFLRENLRLTARMSVATRRNAAPA